ncbi:MAG: hypothetical protein R3176_01265 [Woeseiaceae bacterium]|nr:hypothetical protein [Woeseiaceae bacterium]
MTLVGILGKRSFAVFFLVSFLLVGILAAVNVASRYALKSYVEDQLERIAWDMTAYQSGDIAATGEISTALAATPGITAANELLFLRNSLTTEDIAYVDGEPIRLPWLSLLTTTDASILPAAIRPPADRAVFVLVGTKAQMGNAYADLQNKRHFGIRIEDQHDHGAGTPDGHGHTPAPVEVFDIGLERTVRIERNELNRWFLEQASSPALIPEVGAILVVPYDREIITAFDALARGIVTVHHDDGDIHEEAGNYFPDIIHLLEADTGQLVSGWDIDASLARLTELEAALARNTFAIGPRVFIDNSVGVLLERMQATARRVGLISLLVAIPLIWVGWILMASLSRMLLLNERRKFGLMRLRGASGAAMGRALQVAIAAGALGGGLLGGLVGTLLPLWLYEGGPLPFSTVRLIQPPLLLALFLGIGVAVALAVSRRLVRRTAEISPLEASTRVIRIETGHSDVRFGIAGGLALLVGGYKIVAWIAGVSIADLSTSIVVERADRVLDFLGFPLFVYGVVTLLVSRQRLVNRLLGLVTGLVGGRLKRPIARHVATRPQRVAGFLLITAMMATIGVYPTVITAVFDEKIDRGTSVQVGADVQVTLNAADIVAAGLLAGGGTAQQFAALSQGVPSIVEEIRQLDGVRHAEWTLVEGVSDGVYVPGYGFNGLPLYFIPDAAAYLETVYHEASLGRDADFAELVGRLARGNVLLSPAVTAFTGKRAGETMPVGRDTSGTKMLESTVAGSIWYLPASPLVSVTDRESFDTARIDYVNHLFANNAYLVADPAAGALTDLDVLLTGIQVSVDLVAGTDPERVAAAVRDRLSVTPADVRTHAGELHKVGSDMYVYLARQNVRIYLLGGLLLAMIGILSVAYTNYLEDRRTLALLRIRGAGPATALRFFGAGIFAPTAIGLVLGIATALVVGYGMTNVVWELRAIRNVLSYLRTHLVISEATAAIVLLLCGVILVLGLVLSQWAFRRTVREGLAER